jgi:hypothetical protein
MAPVNLHASDEAVHLVPEIPSTNLVYFWSCCQMVCRVLDNNFACSVLQLVLRLEAGTELGIDHRSSTPETYSHAASRRTCRIVAVWLMVVLNLSASIVVACSI